jgi:adenylate kinase family enzyme
MVKQDRWVMDGNYGGTLDIRLAACDTVVFLDLPRLTCLWRVLRRSLDSRGQARAEMPAGCPERLTWEFVTWIWSYPRRRRGAILDRLAKVSSHQRVAILRSPAEVNRFLELET